MSPDSLTGPGESLIGTVLGGRYRIDQLLGSGGMGSVYRAEHVLMRKAVAVKVLHREMTLVAEVVARFEREAVAAARIEHPHVAAATDFGRLDDGSFFLVLEYVEGQSLSKLLELEQTLPEERALGITRQIVDALAAAHAAGVVHRDLKPDNVMLVGREGADFVKVLDFGIAKVSEDTPAADAPVLTRANTVMGTPEYMAPEQARGDAVDQRADLYTAGVLLYEMLAGTSPFRGNDLTAVLVGHLTQEPPPLPETVSQGTRELVAWLLRKLPEERPASALELPTHLDGLLGFAPLSAVPVQSSQRLRSSADFTPEPGSASPAAFAPTLLGAPNSTPSSALAKAQLWFDASPLGNLSVLRRPVDVGSARVPFGLIALGMFGFVLLSMFGTLLVVALSSKDDGERTEARRESGGGFFAPKEAREELGKRAESGDREAPAELQKVPEGERGLTGFRALGRGFVRLGQIEDALSAYQVGAKAHPDLARDAVVLSDRRRAALDEATSVGALSVLKGFGPTGIDVLYDIWDTQKAVTAKAALAKRVRALLDDPEVEKQASPALQVLLELQRVSRAGSCTAVKALLPRVERDADERIVTTLSRYNERKGCGFLGLKDCNACLRSTKDLASALKSAGARPHANVRAANAAP